MVGEVVAPIAAERQTQGPGREHPAQRVVEPARATHELVGRVVKQGTERLLAGAERDDRQRVSERVIDRVDDHEGQRDHGPVGDRGPEPAPRLEPGQLADQLLLRARVVGVGHGVDLLSDSNW